MNGKWIIWLLLLGVFIISPVNSFSQTTFTEISGTIRHRGIIIPNVSVTVTNIRQNFSRTTTTNIDGFFQFTQLPVDRYTIRAAINGFGAKTRGIIAGIGGTKIFNIDFEVDVAPGSLTGKVSDKDEKVIENVSLTLARKDNPENKIEVEIDEKGVFNIPELSQEKYILTFEAQGFEPKKEEVKIKSKKKEIEIELKRTSQKQGN